MVARIYKGESPAEEIGQAFKKEVVDIMKDAALKMNCSVDELKYRVDNTGQVEVARMEPTEMYEREERRRVELRKLAIRKMKGI